MVEVLPSTLKSKCKEGKGLDLTEILIKKNSSISCQTVNVLSSSLELTLQPLLLSFAEACTQGLLGQPG